MPVAGQFVPFMERIAAVLDRFHDASVGRAVSRAGSTVRLTATDKAAIELVAYGRAPNYRKAYQVLGVGDARRLGRRMADLMESGHPEAQGERALADARQRRIVQELVLSKVEGAEEGMRVLRELLKDEEILPETRVKIAQDLLDRVPEVAKISRSEVAHSGPALALPAHKVDGLLAAIARAQEAAARPEELRLVAGRAIPEAMPAEVSA